MICPYCKNDTPADKMYCEFCGHALDLDFSKVEKSFQAEAASDLEAKTELRFRGYLLLAAFLLFCVFLARQLIPSPEAFHGVGLIYVPPIAEERWDAQIPSRAGRAESFQPAVPLRAGEADLDRAGLPIPTQQ